MIAATIANVNRDPKKKRKPFEATDFIPGYRARPKKIDGTLLKAQMRMAYAGLAGLKNKSEQAQGNAGNAPRNRERNKPSRSNRVVLKRRPSNRNRPNKKQDDKNPEQE